MKSIHSILIMLVMCVDVRSQDIHFSQFLENPSLLNPALTGAAYTMRASACYRDQWGSVTSPYRSYGASFETRFRASEWEKVDKFRSMSFKQRTGGRVSMGLSAYSDNAGDGHLGLTQGNLTVASFVPLSKRSFLSLGLQASVAQRKLDAAKLIFPSQYNGSVYDPVNNSGERISSVNFVYPDFAGGVLWSFKDYIPVTDRHIVARMGVSFYHLAQPEQAFINASSRLPLKYCLHGDFLFGIPNSNVAVAPACLLQVQGPARECVAGAMMRHYLDASSKYTGLVKRSCFSYGVWHRLKDAFIVSMLMEWHEQYAVGVSYDVNVSGLTSASSGRGGFEISLRYTPPAAFLYQMKKDNAATDSR